MYDQPKVAQTTPLAKKVQLIESCHEDPIGRKSAISQKLPKRPNRQKYAISRKLHESVQIGQKCAINRNLSKGGQLAETNQLAERTQLAETYQLGVGEAFSSILIVDCGHPFFLYTRSYLWILESTGERLYKTCKSIKNKTLFDALNSDTRFFDNKIVTPNFSRYQNLIRKFSVSFGLNRPHKP